MPLMILFIAACAIIWEAFSIFTLPFPYSMCPFTKMSMTGHEAKEGEIFMKLKATRSEC